MTDEEVIDNTEPDIHFEPIVQLPPVVVQTLEENEECILKLRSRLYRFDKLSDPGEWKERGTGDVKLLKHNETGKIRLIMRREKTLKLCANHLIQPEMELRPNCGSEKAFVWTTQADVSEEEPRRELLAIRFANAENANIFKTKFDESREVMKTLPQSNGDKTVKDDCVKKEDSTEKVDEAEKSSTTPEEISTSAIEAVSDKLDKLQVVENSGDSQDSCIPIDTVVGAQKGDTSPN